MNVGSTIPWRGGGARLNKKETIPAFLAVDSVASHLPPLTPCLLRHRGCALEL